jgi:hypothetical protein
MKNSNRFAALLVACVGIASFVFFAATDARSQESSASPAVAASAASGKTADTEFGDGVVAEVVSVARGENDVTIKFKYTNNGSKQAEFQKSNYGYDNIAALVYYIDPKNKKKYTVIKDAEGKPLTSLAQNIKLPAGESKAGWAKLPAPPADTTAVTVVLPGAPPFEKVPVTSQ